MFQSIKIKTISTVTWCYFYI